MTLENKIQKLIPTLSGSILVIGSLSEKVLEQIEKQDSILNCYILGSNHKQERGRGKAKRISLKKLKKGMRKKTIDYLFLSLDTAEKYMRYLICDSIAMKVKTIYLFTDDNNRDLQKYQKRYLYFQANILSCSLTSGQFIEIIPSLKKISFLKRKFFFWKMTMIDGVDLISDFLVDK